MISNCIRKISKSEIIQKAFIETGLHCFHNMHKEKSVNLALSFNFHLRNYLSCLRDINKYLILYPKAKNEQKILS